MKLAVALENFVPLNQQQRESKTRIEAEISRLQEENALLKKYYDATAEYWDRVEAAESAKR